MGIVCSRRGRVEALLTEATIDGDLERLRHLMAKHTGEFHTDDVMSGGATLLHLACIYNHLDITKYLVEECDANVQTISNEGDRRPLHDACARGNLEIVQYLTLALGGDDPAKVNARDRNHRTLLHLACEYGKPNVVRFLCGLQSADEEARDGQGNTPLLWTCGPTEYLEVVQYLVTQGVDLNATNHRGQTAMDVAGRRRPRIALLLQEELLRAQRRAQRAGVLSKEELHGNKFPLVTAKQTPVPDDIIFISHTRRAEKGQKDGTMAEKISETIRDAFRGVFVFYDAKIPLGVEWEDYIRKNAASCRILVALLSPEYFQRYWCMEELSLAMNNGATVMPVYGYGMEGPKSLPIKSQFKSYFDNKIENSKLDYWWSCVERLPKLNDARCIVLKDLERGEELLYEHLEDSIRIAMDSKEPRSVV